MQDVFGLLQTRERITLTWIITGCQLTEGMVLARWTIRLYWTTWPEQILCPRMAIWHVWAMPYLFSRRGTGRVGENNIIMSFCWGKRCCGWWPLVTEEAINFPFENFIRSTLFVWFLSCSLFHYPHVFLGLRKFSELHSWSKPNTGKRWSVYKYSWLWNIITYTKSSFFSVFQMPGAWDVSISDNAWRFESQKNLTSYAFYHHDVHAQLSFQQEVVKTCLNLLELVMQTY